MDREALNDFRFLDASLNWMFWEPARVMWDSAWTGHVPFAHWLVKNTRPRLLVELGALSGVSYAAFCEAVVRSRLDTQCRAVDTWAGDEHTGAYDDSKYNDLLVFNTERYGAFSRLLRKTFDEALADVADGTVDVLHIDGFHTYEAVRHDFDTWLPKLSDRAVVLFHDTHERDRDFGVWRLWAELTQQYPGFEFLHSSGLGVLQVGPNAPAALKALCGERDPKLVDLIRSRFEFMGGRITLHRMYLQQQGLLDSAQAQLRALGAEPDAGIKSPQ